MEEVSSFILPLSMSGPNETNFPEESVLLTEFKRLLVTKGSNINNKFSVSAFMTVTFNFLLKTTYYAIGKRLTDCNVLLRADGRIISGLDGDNAKKFFSHSIPADLASEYNPLRGLKEYLEGLTDSNPTEGLNNDDPKRTTFQILGDEITVDHLIRLFNDIREARVKYLVGLLGLSITKVRKILEWLPHGLLVLDELKL